MNLEAARKTIANAEERDEVAYVTAVGTVLDSAYRSRWFPWRRRISRQLFQLVAELDIDDDRIDSLVEDARQYLESKGLACEPSYARRHESCLAQIPPAQRQLQLAKQAMVEAGEPKSARKRRRAVENAIRHYELAAAYAPLSAQHQRILDGLRSRASKGRD